MSRKLLLGVMFVLMLAGAFAPAQAAVRSLGTLFRLEPFIIMLADTGEPHYLRITFQLQLISSDEEFFAEIRSSVPRIRDAVVGVVSQKYSTEVTSPQGKIRLQDELLQAINALMSKGQFTNMFIAQFFVE